MTKSQYEITVNRLKTITSKGKHTQGIIRKLERQIRNYEKTNS